LNERWEGNFYVTLPLIMPSTRLRYIAHNSADVLSKMIEALPLQVEVKCVALGVDKRWYAWFTISDYDPSMNYDDQGKKKRAK
jgi:hypothetical protein